jgi:hypothetical protein
LTRACHEGHLAVALQMVRKDGVVDAVSEHTAQVQKPGCRKMVRTILRCCDK